VRCRNRPIWIGAGGRSAAIALVIGLILNSLSVFLLIRLGLLALAVSVVFSS
jgi:hypothetical protein